MKVELFFFDGCPHWPTVDAVLQRVAAEYGATIQHHRLDTAEQAAAPGIAGSPTILVDGRDPFPVAGAGGLSCRLYQTPDGLAGTPTLEQVRGVLRSQERKSAQPLTDAGGP